MGRGTGCMGRCVVGRQAVMVVVSGGEWMKGDSNKESL